MSPACGGRHGWGSRQEGGNVVAVQFDADGVFHGHGVGLMGRLVEHGGESEEAAVLGLVNQDLLLVLIDGGDADAAGHEDVGLLRWVADFEDALAGGELLEVNLGGENGEFVVVEQFKEGDVFQLIGVAGHG